MPAEAIIQIVVIVFAVVFSIARVIKKAIDSAQGQAGRNQPPLKPSRPRDTNRNSDPFSSYGEPAQRHFEEEPEEVPENEDVPRVDYSIGDEETEDVEVAVSEDSDQKTDWKATMAARRIEVDDASEPDAIQGEEISTFKHQDIWDTSSEEAQRPRHNKKLKSIIENYTAEELAILLPAIMDKYDKQEKHF